MYLKNNKKETKAGKTYCLVTQHAKWAKYMYLKTFTLLYASRWQTTVKKTLTLHADVCE